MKTTWIACLATLLLCACGERHAAAPVYRSSCTILLSRGSISGPMLAKGGLTEDYIVTQQRILQSTHLQKKVKASLTNKYERVDNLVRRLEVEQVWKSSILRISVEAFDARFAADYANALAEAYIDFRQEERMATAQPTVKSLTMQANRLRDELRGAEERLLAFEKESGTVKLKMDQEALDAQVKRLNGEFQELEAERLKLLALKESLIDAEEPVIRQTLRDLKLLRRDEFEGQAAADLVALLDPKIASVEARARASRRVASKIEKRALEATLMLSEHKNLKRNVERLDKLYQLIFDRLKEVEVTAGTSPEAVRIMERAQPAQAPIAK